MTNSHAPGGVSTLHIASLLRWRQIVADITAGRLPTLDELHCGTGFAGNDVKTDIRAWCRDMLLEDAVEDVSDKLAHLLVACSTAALKDLRNSLEHEGEGYVARIDFYLAAMGDDAARNRVISEILGGNTRNFRRVVYGLTIASSWPTIKDPEHKIGFGAAEFVIKSTAADIEMRDAAERMLAAGETAQTPEDQLQDRLAAMAEDRAEIDTDQRITPPPVIDGMVVVRVLPVATGHKKDIGKLWADLAGKPVPVIKVHDIVAPLKIIDAEMPHTSEIAMRMGMNLHVGKMLHLRPILIVGEPGNGKTTFCRRFAELFGAPVRVYNFGGAADAAIGGTSAQYNSARVHSFLQLIQQERVANPVVVLDELEKASPSRYNGSAWDVILPILEAHTASRYLDPALEVEVDLSAVTILATANSLEEIPAPLRDRFTIYRMPDPGWQHVGTLSRNILDRIAEESGLDRRFFPDLAGDELEALKHIWSGGSIRRLERAIRLMCDGRDKLWGQA